MRNSLAFAHARVRAPEAKSSELLIRQITAPAKLMPPVQLDRLNPSSKPAPKSAPKPADPSIKADKSELELKIEELEARLAACKEPKSKKDPEHEQYVNDALIVLDYAKSAQGGVSKDVNPKTAILMCNLTIPRLSRYTVQDEL
jgi:hypothetical protein